MWWTYMFWWAGELVSLMSAGVIARFTYVLIGDCVYVRFGGNVVLLD